MADNFKAHRPEFGEKLGQMQALGPAGLARRIEEARAAERARVIAERGQDFVGVSGAISVEGKGRRGKGGIGKLKGKEAAVEGKRGRGRPGLGKPWEALGVSRATYFSMKRAGGLKEGSGA